MKVTSRHVIIDGVISANGEVASGTGAGMFILINLPKKTTDSVNV